MSGHAELGRGAELSVNACHLLNTLHSIYAKKSCS